MRRRPACRPCVAWCETSVIMNAHAPDDLALHAWLDGELAPERRAEVDAWLAEHPDDAARVRLWAADAQALRARLEPVLDEPVPQALTQVLWRNGPATLTSGRGLGAG